jgi:hypothetical protein
MATSSSSGVVPAWICPSCERQVPGRIRTCRCGFDAGEPEQLLDAPAGNIKQGSTSRAVVLALVTLLIVGGVASYVMSQDSEAQPAAERVTGER